MSEMTATDNNAYRWLVTLRKTGQNGINHALLSVNPTQVYMARQGGASGGWEVG